MSDQLPMLSEHQGIELKTHNSAYTPTSEEQTAITLVKKCLAKSRGFRRKDDREQLWLDDYKMFRGKQWKEERPSYKHSEVVNLIFQAIQGQVPILTDARPRFEYLPQEPQDREIAAIMDDVAKSDWEKGNWLYKLTEVVYDGHIYGTGFSEMCFEARALAGMGQIQYKPKDIFYCFPDPNAKNVNDEADFFVLAEPTDVNKVRALYPDKKDYIKADLSGADYVDKQDLSKVRFQSPTDTPMVKESGATGDEGENNKCLLITAYVNCDDYDEKESLDEQGNKKYTQTKKFPNGRKIVMASGVLLADGANPYEDGLFPFQRLINYIDPHSFYGISDIEQLRSPQKTFNKLVSFALDVLFLMGNPIWIVDNDSEVDTDNLFNKPGLVIEKSKGSEVRREEGVQLQPYVLQLIDRMADWFDGISGAQDVSRGVKPEGITAASAIQSLQEAAQTRLRLKSRNIDAYLQELGQQYKNRVFQFYTAPRVVRVTGDQNAQKYFKFHVENYDNQDGTRSRKVIVRNFNEQNDGSYAEDLDAKEYILRGDLDVRVSTGSSLPFAKTEKINTAKMLFDSGAIDQEELLKSSDWPNWEAVLERMQKAAAEKAQAEAAAKGPQSSAPPPPAA